MMPNKDWIAKHYDQPRAYAMWCGIYGTRP